ncbi:MAG: hypothetical protein E7358_04980 [Clostridiales bacterium]|nr:hypothetical protein [Clostridiales bacterium]
MKNILLIGVGGTGSKTVDILFEKVQELGQNGNNITAVVFDTDAGDIKKIEWATPIPMADNASVGTICDRIGSKFIREWFPHEDKAIRSQEMFRGASQWRKKSYLAFLNTMNKPKFRSSFINVLEKMTLNPNDPCEVYVITSVAGGTGSGSFIPIALFAKKYLRKNLGKSPIINAMIALPDIYADGQTPENATKIYANAYAIFRELNAINLVSRGYNKGDQLKKKAPVRFKIGHAEEPSVGLLFDSMDKSFWSPDAAPFNQVFVLDKIPNVTSVTAHNIVLANSLYSLICTEIGDRFDSEISNHELVHSQNNGSGAMYAGISTSEIRFPKDTILDYVAHEKTIAACEGDMLTLHKAVEAKIKENERQYKEAGRAYTMGETGYADIVMDELKNDAENNDSKINDIVDRGTCVYDKEGNKEPGTNTAEKYFTYLESEIVKKIPNFTEYEDTIEGIVKGDIESAADIKEFANKAHAEILNYFISCAENIKRSKTSLSNAILCLDEKNEVAPNNSLSLINRILKDKDGNFLHPVAALVQLCRFKKKLVAAMRNENPAYADAIKRREIYELPEEFVVLGEVNGSEDTTIKLKPKKSKYFKLENRFLAIKNDDDFDEELKSDLKTDAYLVGVDAKATLGEVSSQSVAELKALVYANVNKALNVLIAKYRSFFVRFEKEKANLIELAKDVRRKDAGVQDSVINVYSEAKEKDEILTKVLKEAGPASAQEVAETDNIVGQGVFTAVFNAACAEVNESSSYNDKDASAINSLFSAMINAYKKSIKNSDAFIEIYNANVVEAIKMACGDDKAKAKDKIKAYFATASESAKPSIKIDMRDNIGDIVKPANCTVFMMSTNTARFIKRNADYFELSVPTDQNKESKVLEACAEQFVRTFSGDESARVAVVSTMLDNILYCTGEVMDVSPLRITKFNELGEDNLYFKQYQKAIRNSKYYETEMWNPHLGNNLHKRGYLPYMNEKMEKIYDDKMVKALFYGFYMENIVYAPRATKGSEKHLMFYEVTASGKKAIRTPDGNEINLENAAQLVKWFRNQDEYIEDWSTKFDEEIVRIKNSLPNISSDTQYHELERKITGCDFMKILNNSLFNVAGYVDDLKNKCKIVEPLANKVGPSIIELAYLVKTSEESIRDCDDAERIINVAYDIFLDICKFRANPDLTLDRFMRIYDWELRKVFEGILSTKMVMKEEKYCKEYVEQIASWFNNIGVFQALSEAKPFNELNELNISDKFDYTSSDVINRAINKATTAKKQDKVEAVEESSSAPAVIEEVAEETPTEEETVPAVEEPAEPVVESSKRGRKPGSKNKK